MWRRAPMLSASVTMLAIGKTIITSTPSMIKPSKIVSLARRKPAR
jgi:hypothetical protein